MWEFHEYLTNNTKRLLDLWYITSDKPKNEWGIDNNWNNIANKDVESIETKRGISGFASKFRKILPW